MVISIIVIGETELMTRAPKFKFDLNSTWPTPHRLLYRFNSKFVSSLEQTGGMAWISWMRAWVCVSSLPMEFCLLHSIFIQRWFHGVEAFQVPMKLMLSKPCWLRFESDLPVLLVIEIPTSIGNQIPPAWPNQTTKPLPMEFCLLHSISIQRWLHVGWNSLSGSNEAHEPWQRKGLPLLLLW